MDTSIPNFKNIKLCKLSRFKNNRSRLTAAVVNCLMSSAPLAGVFCALWDQARFSLFLAFFCWFSQVFITMLWGSSFTRRTCIRTGKPWME